MPWKQKLETKTSFAWEFQVAVFLYLEKITATRQDTVGTSSFKVQKPWGTVNSAWYNYITCPFHTSKSLSSRQAKILVWFWRLILAAAKYAHLIDAEKTPWSLRCSMTNSFWQSWRVKWKRIGLCSTQLATWLKCLTGCMKCFMKKSGHLFTWSNSERVNKRLKEYNKKHTKALPSFLAATTKMISPASYLILLQSNSMQRLIECKELGKRLPNRCRIK